MSCSHCAAATSVFDRRVAAASRKRYEKRGPDYTTRSILGLVRRVPVAGRALLDVGGGIGVLGFELLDGGLGSVTMIEGSSAHIDEARRLYAARERGSRLEVMQGDFVDMDLPAADLVTLDRVVCCYPDQKALLGKAGRSARVLLALSFPRERWYMRAAIATINLYLKLRRNAFRVFVHPEADLRSTLEAAGLRRVARDAGIAWVVEAWEPAAR